MIQTIVVIAVPIKPLEQQHLFDIMEDSTSETPSMENKQKAIDKLKTVLNFLTHSEIQSDEAIVCFDKPLEDLLSYMKNIPVNSSFDNLPTEIVEKILNYQCNNTTFMAAAVCQRWRDILKDRLESLDTISIGKHCSNQTQCENNTCFKPVEMLEASIAHKLNVHLKVCCSLRHVDSQLVSAALTSVSSITITNNCFCDGFGNQAMAQQQLDHLFGAIENNEKVMESLEFDRIDRDQLSILTKKLLQAQDSDIKLTHLSIGDLNGSQLSTDLADALCKIENVQWTDGYISKETAQGLFENILSRPVKIKSLLIGRNIRPANWNTFIDTQDFRNVCGKMEDFSFTARFSEDQVEAVRSVSGVKSTILFDPNGDESKQITISKGF